MARVRSGAGWWRCACNSRLNLVRSFVSPPHPTRARTPPWGGCLCARLRTCARPRLCLPVPARVCVPAPGYLRVRMHARLLLPVRGALARARLTACACASPVISAPAPVHTCASLCAPGPSCAGGASLRRLPVLLLPVRATLRLFAACLFCLCALCSLCAPLASLWILWMLWPAPACSLAPLCRSARLLRLSLLLRPSLLSC